MKAHTLAGLLPSFYWLLKSMSTGDVNFHASHGTILFFDPAPDLQRGGSNTEATPTHCHRMHSAKRCLSYPLISRYMNVPTHSLSLSHTHTHGCRVEWVHLWKEISHSRTHGEGGGTTVEAQACIDVPRHACALLQACPGRYRVRPVTHKACDCSHIHSGAMISCKPQIIVSAA